MRVGIGLPNAVRGVDRAGIVEWAQRAERAGFASLDLPAARCAVRDRVRELLLQP